MTQKLSTRAHPFQSPVYLDGLNAMQKEAVLMLDGPLLVLAGAGTGKTRVLTTRIMHILATMKAKPWEILAVTFTNKAAREMTERVAYFIQDAGAGLPWMGTFHAIGAKILRNHAELVGLKSSFTILNEDDKLSLLKQISKVYHLDEKKYPPRFISGLIDSWKNRGLYPQNLTAADVARSGPKIPDIYAAYQERLRVLNAVDFGDLILLPIRLMQEHPDILAKFHKQFKYILVDEYQDTNVAQYLWLRLLSQGHQNICCVGDDDQSIYGWRGAEVGNILRFEHDFPGAKIIRLEQNYRSTPEILAVASALIQANSARFTKTLWTEGAAGDKVRLIGHWNAEEEARFIAEDIEQLRQGTHDTPPIPYRDMAILVRASHQMRAFEDRLLTNAIPYRVIGGPRFYERQEIRDALAYFRLLIYQDDDLAFDRVVNLPKRGIGEKTLQAFSEIARANGVSLYTAARLFLDENQATTRVRRELGDFFATLDRARAHLRAGADHVEIAGLLLDEIRYTQMWQESKDLSATARLENLKELVEGLASFENLQGFMEHVSLVMENERDAGADKISIMTLHGAKGLEFPVVYLPGWEEGLFPSQRTLDESGVKGLEEERRLAYVGITRARRALVISFAANRRIYNQWQNTTPSRFIDELPQDYIEIPTESLSSLGGSRYHAQADQTAPRGRIQKFSEHSKAPPHASSQTRHAKQALNLGERVFHQKFGYGTIIALEFENALVHFDHSEEKRIRVDFLSPLDDVPF